MMDLETTENIPWPRKGDRLFATGGDWGHNACLGLLSANWDLYADGYKRAGDILVEYVKETQADQDFLVYPIVFLYRQYIELRLKELIQTGNLLLNINREFPGHHKIDELWKECGAILEQVSPEGPKDDLDAVGECITEFSKKDPTSTAFRYPTDKDGNLSITDRQHINLRNLAEVMARLASLLDGASVGLSVYLDAKREIDAEFRESFW